MSLNYKCNYQQFFRPEAMKKSLGLAIISVLLFQSLSVLKVSAKQPKIKSFANWCQQRNYLPPTTKHTIDVILQTYNSKDCQYVDRQSRTVRRIDLSRSGISDIKPLGSLNNLRIINLSENQISNIKPLVKLAKGDRKSVV